MRSRCWKALFVKRQGAARTRCALAVQDSYKRLLGRRMETEMRVAAQAARRRGGHSRLRRQPARAAAVAAARQKRVLAIDPGFRTGCKVVCLDRQGKLLHHDVIYPAAVRPPGGRGGAQTVLDTVRALQDRGHRHRQRHGRPRDGGLRPRRWTCPRAIPIVMVNESGASIYSASEVAREEFPDQDITVRGAVSIGRRLHGPAGGAGEDRPQVHRRRPVPARRRPERAQASLDDVVVSCVNAVGVEVNTASKQLLTYVSGSERRDWRRNIVAYRNENGPFRSRRAAAQGAAPRPQGVRAGGRLPAHPRRREPARRQRRPPGELRVVERMAADLGCTVRDLMRDAGSARADRPRALRHRHGRPAHAAATSSTNWRSPAATRAQQFEAFAFAEGVTKMEDLPAGHEAAGHRHQRHRLRRLRGHRRPPGRPGPRQPARRPVRAASPTDVVKVHQKVQVTVVEVDPARKRIALSMRKTPGEASPERHAAAVPKTVPAAPAPAASQRRPKNEPFNNPFAALLKKR